ncbi:unnamed protein product [Effrenium voratum]|nr:unnamed protein product [Effrenium voratum]|eukprot:CAMPEP_0181412320 /NCGR_PEP_ID=MMETSP1110-20121109/8358_1 /TAXON_ID=174948 /ORGANISM="Symbiodinium sp., Strain CCMP421" /LENGTH=283 /DNA_ID=CAMNT_0023535023 /DNA_START=29 /DNA_END=880 /DNA_ORIENTATION=-
MASEKPSWRNWANLVAFVLNLGITYGSLTGIFGKTNTDLSAKYQTLVTPAGWAFSIWGPIFIWEGVFAATQMCQKWRDSSVVVSMTPFWLAACAFQCLWTVTFAQEQILLSCICMLGILLSLLAGIAWTDRRMFPASDFWLLRAPFSLHGGWIVAASAVNINVLGDRFQAEPDTQLALAIVSLGVVFALVSRFGTAPRGDAIICLVAAWALAAIYAELGKAEHLKDPTRFNFYDWPDLDLRAVRLSALILSLSSLGLAVVATIRRLTWQGTKHQQAEASLPFA